MFVVLLGFSALSIDVGRYYAERRFLQDAADAAALACARAYGVEGTATAAWDAADTILGSYNLNGNPLGLTVTYPAYDATGLTYTYYDDIVTAENLKNGIRPQTSPDLGCRVALYVDVPTLLIQVVNPGLDTLDLGVRAYAIARGGFLPVIVKKYSNGPGPGDGSESGFIHHAMKSGSDFLCTVISDVGCTAASEAEPGREFVLFGASQKGSDNKFRGFLVLDIRDFSEEDPNSGELLHDVYNGVAVDANENTLKDFEAQWIRNGYPGPDICTVDANEFQGCAQIAIINGASAGLFIDEVADRYKQDDVILAQLYDGSVKTIPNFTINFPNLIIGSGSESVADQDVAFTFSTQYAAALTAQVDVTFYPDNGTITGGSGDALNPWVTGNATSGTFATDPTPPRTGATDTSYTMTWSGITTDLAPKGIYVVFLHGDSSAPYNDAEQLQIVTVNIDDQEDQFFIDSSDTYVNTADATVTARTATYTIRVVDGNGQEQWTGGADSVTLKIDDCPSTWTCYFGATSPGSPTLVTEPGNTHTLTVEVPAGTSNNTIESGWIRAYGLDGAAAKVTRVQQFQTAVNVATGGSGNYVDVIGYALFKVTTIDANDVYGQAISGTYLDPNDSALAEGKKFGLVPWEEP